MSELLIQPKCILQSKNIFQKIKKISLGLKNIILNYWIGIDYLENKNIIRIKSK